MKKPIKLGTIITAIIMVLIVWAIFASMGGEPDSWNSDTQNQYDGGSRAVYP